MCMQLAFVTVHTFFFVILCSPVVMTYFICYRINKCLYYETLKKHAYIHTEGAKQLGAK